MSQEKNEKTNLITSVQISFSIIELIEANGVLTFTEIEKNLDRSKSTIHDHLTTLQTLDYITKTGDGYGLGLKFLSLSDVARSRHPIYKSGKAEIDQLVEETGERAQIMIEENGWGWYIYQSMGQQAIKTDSHEGQRIDLHATATGKSYLAFQPQKRVDNLLNQPLPEFTDNTITDQKKLQTELKSIREQGWAFNQGERVKGMRAVGAPVLNQNNTAIAAISVSGPATRLHGERLEEELSAMVEQIAEVIAIKTIYD